MVRDALNGEPSYESVLKALQNLYGEQVEVKSREERFRDLEDEERRAKEQMKRIRDIQEDEIRAKEQKDRGTA